MRVADALLLMTALLLAACGEVVPPGPSPQSLRIADQFCAKVYPPWMALVDQCSAEKIQGPGPQCAVLAEVNVLLDQRKRKSHFTQCSMEIRFGFNEKK